MAVSQPICGALEAALIENRGALLAFIGARLDKVIAEDILQDIWIRLLRDRQLSEGVQSPLGYLFRMAQTMIIDHERRRRAFSVLDREFARTSLVNDQIADIGTEEALIMREYIRHAEVRLQRAGKRVAEVFRLHRIDGKTQRQVAEELGVSLGTVENDLRKAIKLLVRMRAEFERSGS
ncbi:sigma-70 family RNA polymerase sigma factor [Sphingomonas sp. 2R-10]|uniref:RNA polymerase sigma factor n=1 Tax=Sphingomonas sp. 2R-10 TaxID=3045148 RepID=UPI000F7A469C|nr:sigma-70 family RNA polymerase sigma factor [Sphingomonas sp. 2R-10]MDJ0276212.1 sigma-70 family RNA polymerase sigma factor [Sphingomonas sp. 2R-10]